MKAVRVAARIMTVTLCLALFAGGLMAAEKLEGKGKIKDYDVSKKTVVVTIDGKDTTFVVEHGGALKKLGDRLEKGDEVKVKYFNEGGKNVIKSFNDLKGTKPGC
ncbi:MAG: hypothetical protein AB1805_11230 [Nitrospirota bacterium]